MKLMILGLSGVVAACLIFIAVVLPPWSELATSFSSSSRPPPDTPVFPLPDRKMMAVDISISNFTEPLGLGSEANVTVSVISRKDMANVKVEITLSQFFFGDGEWPNMTWTPVGPKGIELVDGNLTWIVNLSANVSVSAAIRIRAVEVGFGVLSATATCWETASKFYENGDVIWIKVLEAGIKVYYGNEPIHIP